MLRYLRKIAPARRRTINNTTIIINNPTPELASESIRKTLRRLGDGLA